jgi:HK97 family phage major capsid protein
MFKMKKLTSLLYWGLFGMIALFVAFGTVEAALLGAFTVPVLVHYVAQPLTFVSLTSGLPSTKTFNDFLKEKGEDPDKMSEKSAEELAGLYNEFNEKNRQALAEAIEGKASKEDIEALEKSIKDTQEQQLKQLNETLKEHGLAIKQVLRKPETQTSKSFSQQLREALEDNADKLKVMKEGGISEVKANAFEFSLKAPADMTFGNVSGGNIPVEDRLEGFNIIPSRRVRLLDVMSQRSTTSNVVSWVSQANKDGSAGQTAEGAEKNQIDYDIVVSNEAVKKTTAFIKVSTEMLDDIEWMQSEIENELMREVLKAVESTAYSGDGLGQNHRGIRTVASAFAAGTFAGTIDNANDVDVLTVAMNQIEIAQENEGLPTAIFMHPSDVTSLLVTKVSATDKRYVDRLIQVGSNLILDGVPIIKSTLITQGQYLVGAFDLALLVTRQAMRFDIGLDADDFTKNLRTILGEWRGLTLVKTNDRSAFVAGVFATDAAALETA